MILPSTAPASGSARVEHGDGQTGVEQVVNWMERDNRNTQEQTGEERQFSRPLPRMHSAGVCSWEEEERLRKEGRAEGDRGKCERERVCV